MFAARIGAKFVRLMQSGAASEAEDAARRQSFVPFCLALSSAAIGVMPFYLAFRGVPTPFETLAFIWSLMPLCAVALVTLSAAFRLAGLLCALGIIVTGLSLAVGGGTQGALAWLTIAPLTGLFIRDARVTRAGGCAAGVALAGVAVANLWGGGDPSLTATVLCVLPLVGLATWLAVVQAGRSGAPQSEAARWLRPYRTVLDHSGDLVLCHDRAGGVAFVGGASEAVLGVPPSELMGRGFFDRIHVSDRPRFLKAIADTVEGQTGIVATVRLRGRNGLHDGDAASNAPSYPVPTFPWVELRMNRFEEATASSDAPSVGVVALLRDVTEMKARQDEIEAARAAAEQSNASKDHFLANVSHELRTPLNAIIGFAEMLNNVDIGPRDPAKQREYAGIIQQSGLHLLDVVNSILDLSKIQAGRFDLLAEPFDIGPLIDSCCDMLKLKAEEKGLAFVRAYPDVREDLVADPRACKQILLNLLSNAVKFTPAHGRVTIGARPDGTSVIFTVSDTGIGIPARDLTSVGHAFFQATATHDRGYEGTGLGLSVVRGLVGLHGGSITIESEPGQGTCVTVRLPLDCRHVPVRAAETAKIETISRRSRFDAGADFPRTMKVKKIA